MIDVGFFFGRPDRSQALADRLTRRGFRITVYGDHGEPGTYVPVPCSLGAALARLLRTPHHAYVTGLLFVPALALYVNRLLRGRPYVYNATGVVSATHRERSLRWPCPRLVERRLYPVLERRVLAGAAAIVCNSRYLERTLAGAHPTLTSRMRTVYNGIDFDRFTSGRRLTLEGIPPGHPTLLSVTTWNFAPKAEGAELLIDAMGPITARCPGARLIIAVVAQHRRYAEPIEARLASRPWRDAVTIVYNRADVHDLLASADVFVYASGLDSLPRALLEAHAAGLPIVTTAAAGCAEVVEDGVTGFVVEPDPAPLADRTLALLEDDVARSRFGARGRERVRDVFSWDRMADGYAEVLEAVAAGGTDT
jgi:glycosyltransferase involved in cell wall biosynthesis